MRMNAYRSLVHPGFDDKTVTMGAPDQLAELSAVLGSSSRLAILRVLMASDKPLNINEVARRVGLDASPVRMHLQVMAAASLVDEAEGMGRERRFTTRLTGIRLTLEGAGRAARRVGPPPKAAQRLGKKLADLQKDIAKLEAKARATADEIEATWRAKEEG